MKPIREMELAWAAGFFDGEGNCSYNKASGQMRIEIGQGDEEVLERFLDAVGIGTINGPYVSKSSFTRCKIWKYQVSSAFGVKLVISKIYPMLSTLKQLQIDEALEAYENRDMAELARKRRERRLAHA